jgi:hypothetical protein
VISRWILAQQVRHPERATLGFHGPSLAGRRRYHIRVPHTYRPGIALRTLGIMFVLPDGSAQPLL